MNAADRVANRAPLPDSLREALAARFGSRFSTSAAVRLQHGRDESSYAPAPPDAVVSPSRRRKCLPSPVSAMRGGCR